MGSLTSGGNDEVLAICELDEKSGWSWKDEWDTDRRRRAEKARATEQIGRKQWTTYTEGGVMLLWATAAATRIIATTLFDPSLTTVNHTSPMDPQVVRDCTGPRFVIWRASAGYKRWHMRSYTARFDRLFILLPPPPILYTTCRTVHVRRNGPMLPDFRSSQLTLNAHKYFRRPSRRIAFWSKLNNTCHGISRRDIDLIILPYDCRALLVKYIPGWHFC